MLVIAQPVAEITFLATSLINRSSPNSKNRRVHLHLFFCPRMYMVLGIISYVYLYAECDSDVNYVVT